MQTETKPAADKTLWAYRTTAALPDSTGRYRTAFIGFSDLYDWSDQAIAETLERERVLKTALVGPLSREDYDAICRGEWNGYCSTPDADAPVDRHAWHLAA